MIKTPLSTVIGGAFWTPKATIVGGASRTLNQIIKSLFANNEQGFAYDPNDLTTMYKDAAGTMPVTDVGQPVGLILDKSKGLVLGSELITNGDFSNGSAGWTLSSAIVSGGSLVATSATDLLTYSTNPLTIGKWYKVEFDVLSYTNGIDIRIVSGANTSNRVPAYVGHKKAFVCADGTAFRVQAAGGPFTGTIDNISVKEVSGNHAYQTTSSMRPLLVASPQRLDFDTADDKLITNLPAQLTGCTVIRSVPNVGTQILTGQTIPATYEDNTDHCGLIVINRALTATETSQITKLFNKASGV